MAKSFFNNKVEEKSFNMVLTVMRNDNLSNIDLKLNKKRREATITLVSILQKK